MDFDNHPVGFWVSRGATGGLATTQGSKCLYQQQPAQWILLCVDRNARYSSYLWSFGIIVRRNSAKQVLREESNSSRGNRHLLALYGWTLDLPLFTSLFLEVKNVSSDSRGSRWWIVERRCFPI